MDEPKDPGAEKPTESGEEGGAPADEQEVYSDTRQTGETPKDDPFYSPETSEMLNEVPSYMARGVLYVLLLILAVGLAWAYYGRMDVVVSGAGRLVPVGELKVVQAKTNGYLTQIMVKVGDHVKKDQVLAKLDLTVANIKQEAKRKSFAKQKRDYECLQYAIEIFERVLKGAQPGETRRDILKLCSSGYAGEILKLHATNVGFEKSKLQHYELHPGSLNTLKDAVRLKTREMENKRKALLAAQAEFARVSKEFGIYKTMVEKGLSSQIKLLEKQKAYDEALSKIRDTELELKQAEGQVSDAKIKLAHTRLQYNNAWREAKFQYDQAVETAGQKLEEFRLRLDEAKKAIETGEKQLFLERYESQQHFVQAPADGIIAEVFVKNPAQVLRAGATIFTILPSDQPLVGKVLLANKNIGRVTPGLPVKMKFHAYPYQEYGLGRGKVVAISPTPKVIGGNSFFEIRVALNRDYLAKGKKKYKFFTGLTFSGEVVVETKRVIDVFLKPFKGLKGA